MFTIIHRINTQNVGDLMSGPQHYFSEFSDSPVIDILGLAQDDPEAQRRWLNVYEAAKVIIVGGGGLLNMPKFDIFWKKVIDDKKNIILWGCGHNETTLESWLGLRRRYKIDLSRFLLSGTRDAGVAKEWVPCVSCMSPLFDKQYTIEKEVIFFANKATSNSTQYIPTVFRNNEDVSLTLGNQRHTMEKIINFLASAETVITSSYHGAYWATLLGRKVVAIPTSSKFYSLHHPVPLCHPEDWSRYRSLARIYPDALRECREANINFKHRVLELAGKMFPA